MSTTIWAERATDTRLAPWLRVVAYAEAHANQHGHCPLLPEQLHHAIDPTWTKAAISKAIKKAIEMSWLHPASSARCLVLPTCPTWDTCPATHRRTGRGARTSSRGGGSAQQGVGVYDGPPSYTTPSRA